MSPPPADGPACWQKVPQPGRRCRLLLAATPGLEVDETAACGRTAALVRAMPDPGSASREAATAATAAMAVGAATYRDG